MKKTIYFILLFLNIQLYGTSYKSGEELLSKTDKEYKNGFYEKFLKDIDKLYYSKKHQNFLNDLPKVLNSEGINNLEENYFFKRTIQEEKKYNETLSKIGAICENNPQNELCLSIKALLNNTKLTAEMIMKNTEFKFLMKGHPTKNILASSQLKMIMIDQEYSEKISIASSQILQTSKSKEEALHLMAKYKYVLKKEMLKKLIDQCSEKECLSLLEQVNDSYLNTSIARFNEALVFTLLEESSNSVASQLKKIFLSYLNFREEQDNQLLKDLGIN